MNFLYVKIPFTSRAADQVHQLQDKVDEILTEHRLGSVAGWGDSLGDKLPDGSRPVAFTRIDVDVSDLRLAAALLQANMPSFGTPAGTEIHYTIDGHHCTDVYVDSSWSSDRRASPR